MAKKKPGKKKRKLTFDCPNSGRAFDLDTLVGMLQNKPSGFATFFFPIFKDAMNNNPTAIACVESYLLPTTDQLMGLGIQSSGVGAKKSCTESGLLVAVIAKQNA
jgi:hypothetical protein